MEDINNINIENIEEGLNNIIIIKCEERLSSSYWRVLKILYMSKTAMFIEEIVEQMNFDLDKQMIRLIINNLISYRLVVINMKGLGPTKRRQNYRITKLGEKAWEQHIDRT